MEVFAVVVFLLVADALGMRYGADSRDGRDWQPHRLRRVVGRV
jgi:hypothetical protein